MPMGRYFHHACLFIRSEDIIVSVMFRLINVEHEAIIRRYLTSMRELSPDDAAAGIMDIVDRIRADIPEKKRISLGRYSIIRDVGLFLHPLMKDAGRDISETGRMFFDNKRVDPFVRSLGIQLITVEADTSGSPETALEYLELAAADEDWIVRECSSGFVRKLVKNYTDFMHAWYLEMVKSDDPLKRRFASESLRPVAENTWFRKNPDFAFSIIGHLFRESSAYPRTSAGNSLSDWMRINREYTLPIVMDLAASGDSNSYWIAYRACRNLVKKDPLLVMDILKTDVYKYKDREFRRADLQ